MAHAIGCLGSAVQTYRTERAKSKKRAAKRARLLNQNRKPAIVAVSHDEGATFRFVKCRQGHLHHVQQAFIFADIVAYPSKALAKV